HPLPPHDSLPIWGLRINEPATDLAAAAALVSSLSGVAIPRHRVHFGEVSLSGAINATPLMGPRLKEAQKLGFRDAIVPAQGELDTGGLKLKPTRLMHLRELADGLPSCD
ncbi:MAG: magnesium chelatase domain-containing protein, partial [Hyphomicrobium sp.]